MVILLEKIKLNKKINKSIIFINSTTTTIFLSYLIWSYSKKKVYKIISIFLKLKNPIRKWRVREREGENKIRYLF